MTEQKDRWTRAVAKLIERTQSGELQWRLVEPSDPEAKNLGENANNVFIAVDQDKTLRIYNHTYHEFVGFDPTKSLILRALGKPTSPFADKSQVVLEFISSSYTSIYRFPDTEGLRDLLSAIKYRVSGAQEYLDELLKDEEA